MTHKTIIANWKMHGSATLINEITPALLAWSAADPYATAIICPPFPYLNALKQALFDSDVKLGAQDCHAKSSGAYTGDVSAEMLVENGCTHVILGHSERRAQHGETNEQVHAKATAALAAGLTPVICIGESLAQRSSGNAVEIVVEQAKQSTPNPQSPIPNPHLLLAYEPIWAIGTGKVPSLEEIAEMHQALKAAMKEHLGTPPAVLYGGSVKAANAAPILALESVDGALVGGASLDKNEFLGILNA